MQGRALELPQGKRQGRGPWVLTGEWAPFDTGGGPEGEEGMQLHACMNRTCTPQAGPHPVLGSRQSLEQDHMEG
jgi:hypothetical protein